MSKQKKFANLVFFIAVAAVLVIAFDVAIALKRSGAESRNRNSETLNLAEKTKADNRDAIANTAGQAIKSIPPVTDRDHILGSLDAPVKMIVYSDFNCPFCADYSDTLNKVKDEFKDKVVIAFRHFPLSTSPESSLAALSSECAAEQGKFWDMYAKLFEDNRQGTFTADMFNADAKSLKLDTKKFGQCLTAKKYMDKIDGQAKDASNVGVIGAPATFINGAFYPGAFQLDDFKDSQGNDVKGLRTIISKDIPKS